MAYGSSPHSVPWHFLLSRLRWSSILHTVSLLSVHVLYNDGCCCPLCPQLLNTNDVSRWPLPLADITMSSPRRLDFTPATSFSFCSLSLLSLSFPLSLSLSPHLKKKTVPLINWEIRRNGLWIICQAFLGQTFLFCVPFQPSQQTYEEAGWWGKRGSSAGALSLSKKTRKWAGLGPGPVVSGSWVFTFSILVTRLIFPLPGLVHLSFLIKSFHLRLLGQPYQSPCSFFPSSCQAMMSYGLPWVTIAIFKPIPAL